MNNPLRHADPAGFVPAGDPEMDVLVEMQQRIEGFIDEVISMKREERRDEL